MKQGNSSIGNENDSLLFVKYLFSNICSSVIRIRVSYTSIGQNSNRNQPSTYIRNSDQEEFDDTKMGIQNS